MKEQFVAFYFIEAKQKVAFEFPLVSFVVGLEDFGCKGVTFAHTRGVQLINFQVVFFDVNDAQRLVGYRALDVDESVFLFATGRIQAAPTADYGLIVDGTGSGWHLRRRHEAAAENQLGANGC